MKTTNKIITALTVMLLTLTSAYADETSTLTTASWQIVQPKKEMLKEYKSRVKENIQKQHLDVKANLNDFKNEYWKLNTYMSWITEEVKKQIETLKTQHIESVEAIKTEYQEKIASWATLEIRQSLRDEMQAKLEELSKTYFENLKDLLWDRNAEIQKYIDARKQVFEENSQIRKDSRDQRKEIKSEKIEMMLKYKEQFAKKVWANLEKISKKAPERLDVVLTKIEPLIAKYQASTKLTSVQKEKLVSQLQALQNLIKEIQATQNVLDETISE